MLTSRTWVLQSSLPTIRYLFISVFVVALSLLGGYLATRNPFLLLGFGAIAVLLIVLRYPFVGYLMLIATTWLDSINPFILQSGLTLNRLLVVAMLASILMRSLVGVRGRKLTVNPFEVFAAVFLLSAALSVVINGIGVRTTYQLSGFIIGFFYYWLAVRLIDDPQKLEWLMIVMVTGTIIIAVSVLWDAYTATTGIRYSGLQTLEASSSQTAMGIPILLYLVAKRRSFAALFIGALLAGVFLIAVLLTGSRASLFSLVAVFLTLLLFLPIKAKLLLLVTAAVVGVVSLQIALAINPNFETRLAFLERDDLNIEDVTSEELSFAARQQVYDRALLAFQTSPIYGIGYGSLQNWGGFSRSSHSIFLNVLGEQGLLGFVPLLLMYGYLLILYIKQIKALQSTSEKVQRILLLSTLIGYDIVIASFSISTLQRLVFLYYAFPVIMSRLDNRQLQASLEPQSISE